MIKLGIYSKEKENQKRKEGYFLASKQYEEHLEFVFREEATLTSASDPEYKLLQKKKTFYIRQLEKIDYKPSENALKKMKHSMYNQMSDLIREEMMQLQEIQNIRKTAPISRKIKKMNQILEYIAEILPSTTVNQPKLIHNNIKESV